MNVGTLYATVWLGTILLPLFWLLRVLAFLATCIPIFSTRIGLQNLQQRMQVTGLRAHVLLSSVYMNYVYTFFEFLFWVVFRANDAYGKQLMRMRFLKTRKKYARTDDSGFALLGGHLNNFDLNGAVAARVLKTIGSQFYAFAKVSRVAWVTRFLTWYRHRRGMQILWTDKRSFVRDTLQAIQQGGTISSLNDQKPQAGGSFQQFLGARAAFPSGALEICTKYKMPFLFCWIRRIVPGVCIVWVEEGCNDYLLQSKSHPAAVDEVLCSYISWLERVILEDPSQWSWDYKKWSRREVKHADGSGAKNGT